MQNKKNTAKEEKQVKDEKEEDKGREKETNSRPLRP